MIKSAWLHYLKIILHLLYLFHLCGNHSIDDNDMKIILIIGRNWNNIFHLVMFILA